MAAAAAPPEKPRMIFMQPGGMYILCGNLALAGAAQSCGQTAGHPFDLIKMRLQVQGRDGRPVKN
eukprot:gene22602-21507_t